MPSVVQGENEEGVDAATSPQEPSDDLDIAADIDAFVEAVTAEGGDPLDEELDEELESLAALVGDPSDSMVGALELDDGDIEELEGEARPLSLYLEIDGVIVEVDKDRFVIGRVSSLCDYAIVDVNVSREHCAIERRDDGYHLVDCGSINGVTLDGQRVDEHRLAPDDILELAGHTIRVRFAPKGALGGADETEVGEPEPEPSTSELEQKAATRAAPVRPPAADTSLPRPHTRAAPPDPAEQVQLPPTPQSFEARIEQRLEQMSRQIADLQEGMQHLLAGLGQIQDAAAVARAIRKRIGG
jgi:pSer/pThr/pTyr-binding forkhead associated (FHA) protein